MLALAHTMFAMHLPHGDWISMLVNHLWQSTLLVAAAWLLTFVLRANQARSRYWLWLTCSAKFLLPFSLLVGMGSHLALQHTRQDAADGASMYTLITQTGLEFAQPMTPRGTAGPVAVPVRDAVASFSIWQAIGDHLPMVLMVVWAAGFFSVLIYWWLRWQRVRATVARAVRVESGREVEILRRLEAESAATRRIDLAISQEMMEPGVVGILRPVLVWPAGISARLNDAHLEAIAAHELAHVRRRDNLAALLHMLVEAAFWFYPPVWWLGARLVEERERACDEEVLRIHNRREVYAESILKVCEFCVETQMACVSGITGADLKKRIVNIMTQHVAGKLNFSKKLLLVAAAVVAIAVPVSFGVMSGQAPAATSASAAGDITGIWQGTTQTPEGQSLREEVKITKAPDGGWSLVLYSLDMGGRPLIADFVSLKGAALEFSMKPPIGLIYVGTLSADGKTINGSFKQVGNTYLLNLVKTDPADAWPLPEMPKPMAADAKPGIDVATIKPSEPGRPGKGFGVMPRGVRTINTNVNDLIMFAYGVNVKQIVGGPDWLGNDKFDIEIIPDVPGRPSHDQFRLVLQKLLADRFQLKLHDDKRELSVYAVTVAKGGPKFTPTKSGATDGGGFLYRGLGQLRVTNETMAAFCDGMQGSAMDRPVVDQTGLTGRYDFTLDWTPDDSQFLQMRGNAPLPPVTDPNPPPSLYTALGEQLGLKMEATKAMTNVIVIDHIDHPSPN